MCVSYRTHSLTMDAIAFLLFFPSFFVSYLFCWSSVENFTWWHTTNTPASARAHSDNQKITDNLHNYLYSFSYCHTPHTDRIGSERMSCTHTHTLTQFCILYFHSVCCAYGWHCRLSKIPFPSHRKTFSSGENGVKWNRFPCYVILLIFVSGVMCVNALMVFGCFVAIHHFSKSPK